MSVCVCGEEVWRAAKDSEQDEEEEEKEKRSQRSGIMKSRASRLEGGASSQNNPPLLQPHRSTPRKKV